MTYKLHRAKDVTMLHDGYTSSTLAPWQSCYRVCLLRAVSLKRSFFLSPNNKPIYRHRTETRRRMCGQHSLLRVSVRCYINPGYAVLLTAVFVALMCVCPCIVAYAHRRKLNYMSLNALLYLWYAQHVSGTSMPIIRSSRLYVCYFRLWCSVVKELLDAKTTVFYIRYVDDNLIIYNTKHNTPETIYNHINKRSDCWSLISSHSSCLYGYRLSPVCCA